MTYTPINFQHKFSLFTEQWAPKVVAEMNVPNTGEEGGERTAQNDVWI